MEVPENRKWINNRVDSHKNITEEFDIGVDEFIKFALKKDKDNIGRGDIRCPCKKCKCLKFLRPLLVRTHLCLKKMADNDNTKGGGRGTGRGINRGRKGWSTTTLSQSNIGKPINPSKAHIATNTQLHPTHLSSKRDKGATTSSHTEIPNSTPTPHICPTPSPSHVPLDAVLGDDPPPQIGSKDPSDGRIWICPGPTKTFDPCIKPRREITKIIKRKFEGSWTTYGEIKGKKDKGKNEEENNNNKKNDKDVAELWFGEFKRKFKWLPEHDEDIRKAFDHKASSSYSNAMYRVRKGIDQGDWIPNKMRAILDGKWKEDNWKKKAELNKVNRISSDGPLHTGGSIPTTEHYKRLKKSSDTSPTCWQLFQTTHKVKGDPNKWVSKKSEGIANKYEEKILERDSQEPLGDDASIHQADDIIFLDVVGGVDKKGRIYGFGPEAEKYKPSRSFTYDGISSSEYQHMRTIISDLSAENTTLKEKLKTHEELIHQSQEDSRLLREQLFQFMAKFSSSHHLPPHSDPPPPPPPTT